MRATVAIILCAAFAGFLPFPVRADDAADIAALEQRVRELEKKTAALEAQIAALEHKSQADAADTDSLSAAEEKQFKEMMDAVSPDQRQQIETMMKVLSPADRVVTIRRLLKIPVADIKTSTRREQAVSTLEDLRLLDSAADQYAIETNKVTGAHATFGDLKNYLKPGTRLYNTGADVLGHTFGPFTVDSIPLVSPETFNALSDVADPTFWSPYK